MARGGYRKPTSPAPVSGPGRLSRRTDGNPTQGAKTFTGGKYGEAKQMAEMQSGAPMAAAAKPSVTKQSTGMANPVTQLFAPTQFPSEPVTAGMPFGPGGGAEMLSNANNGPQKISDALRKILPNDVTGEVTQLYNYLISRGF